MKSNKTAFGGFIMMIAIFTIANLIGRIISLPSGFIPSSFIVHSTMLLFSITAIWIMNKELNFHIALPKFKKIIKPFFIGVIITFIVNIPMNVITTLMNGKVTPHPILLKLNFLQTFLFVFLLASIAEEFLFRGFFQNALKKWSEKGITILKHRFSLPVIIGAISFGLAHLILIFAGVDYLFLIRIVLFTAILGLAAGYYQEKNENNTSFAIIVHMGGNLLGLLGGILINVQT